MVLSRITVDNLLRVIWDVVFPKKKPSVSTRTTVITYKFVTLDSLPHFYRDWELGDTF